ncbi:MAG TPA: electron transfer flavoprotein subunit alpha/FixB family protein [Acidimicrobiales bacterium]|nr:electron transfer flavoprotein subunit alpha/FixB family protein [Acidimicrobiales bacterium]
MPVERVWVVTESTGGVAAPAGLELLAAARRLGVVIEAVHWGADADAVAGELGRHGATRVLTVGDLGGALPAVPVAAALAARVEGGLGPDAVFLTTTYDQRDLAGRLSARLDRPVLTNAVGVSPGGGGDGGEGLVAEHAVFGGATVVRARITAGPPHLFVFRPRSFTSDAAGGPPAEVEVIEVPDSGPLGAATVTHRHVTERTGPALDEAAVVVAGGRGLGDPSRFELVEQLAMRLGGAPAGTRAVVDAGWVPYSYQVGQTGKTVKPNVYVACGISGATQHLVGMKGARHIVAINKDRDAPIFGVADLGVVGDVTKILPRLIEALDARDDRGGTQ